MAGKACICDKSPIHGTCIYSSIYDSAYMAGEAYTCDKSPIYIKHICIFIYAIHHVWQERPTYVTNAV